jgi:hypothetical protein
MELEINELVREKIESLNISNEKKKTIRLLLENEINYGDSKEMQKQKVADAKSSVERGVRNENSSS